VPKAAVVLTADEARAQKRGFACAVDYLINFVSVQRRNVAEAKIAEMLF
jgi:hypothetical protein